VKICSSVSGTGSTTVISLNLSTRRGLTQAPLTPRIDGSWCRSPGRVPDCAGSSTRGGAPMAFDAFISYSHAADGRLAPALQRTIQRLAKPWYRARALRVFRDESALSANPHLWSSIQTALDESEWFVLLASPDAVASEWVNRELDHWLSSKSPDRILVVVTDGTWQWGANTRAITGTAVPPTLRDAFTEEPRHVDLRWARTETDLDLRNSRFRDVVAQLAAPLHGVARDDLEGEDIRQHRRTLRLARAAVACLALLLVLAMLGGALAFVNGRRAVRERDRASDEEAIANVRRLAAEAIAGADADPARSLLLAVEAHRRSDSIDMRSALLTTLLRVGPLVAVRKSSADSAVAATLSSNGRRAAVADEHGIVRVIDVGTGDIRHEFRTTHNDKITLIRLSRDERLIATGDREGVIELRNVADGTVRCPPLRLSTLPIASGAFVARGNAFVAQDDGAYAERVWDTKSCKETGSQGNIVSVYSGSQEVAVSPDGTRLAFAGFPTAVWDARLQGPPQSVSSAGLVAIRAVAITPDGKRVIFADEHRLYIFEVDTRALVRAPIEVVRSKPDRLRVSPDGRRIAVALTDGSIDVIDLQTGAGLEQTLRGLSTPPLDISFTGAHRLTAVGANETAAWDLDRLNATASTFEPELPAYSVEFAPDSKSLAVAAEDGAIHRFALRDKHEIARLKVHEAVPVHGLGLGVTDLAFDPAGKWLLTTADTDARLAVTDLQHNVPLHHALRLGKPALPVSTDADVGVYDLALASSAEAVAVTNGGGELILVDIGTWRERWRIAIPIQSGWLHPVDFAVGQALIYAGTNDGLGVYDAADGHRLDFVQGERVTAVAASPDGQTVAAAFADGTVVILDARTRHKQLLLTNPDGLTSGLAFVPQQQMLAASASNGTVRLWHLPTGHLVGQSLPSPPGDVGLVGAAHVAASPDGRSIAVAYHPGGVIVWNVDPTSWRASACEIAGRNLSRAEWTQLIASDVPYHATCPQWPAGT
jgi:WD40 repeat protein